MHVVQKFTGHAMLKHFFSVSSMMDLSKQMYGAAQLYFGLKVIDTFVTMDVMANLFTTFYGGSLGPSAFASLERRFRAFSHLRVCVFERAFAPFRV